MITEENLPQTIATLYKTNNNYVETLKEIEKDMPTGYNSITSNYLPIFIYHLIECKVDQRQFREVTNYIYDTKSERDIECMFHRFFTRDTDMGIKEYCEEGRKGASQWDNMAYAFLDWNSKGYTIEQNNLPYLKTMLETITEDQVGGLYMGGFHVFTMCLQANFQELVPIIEIAQTNPAFLKEREKYYRSFMSGLLNDVGDNGYNLPQEKRHEIFNVLSEHVKDFPTVFNRELIKFDAKAERFQLHYGLLAFHNCLPEGSVIANIDSYYRSFVNKTEISQTYDKNSTQQYAGWINAALSVGFDDQHFTLDFNLIDTNKSIFHNWVPIKILDVAFKNNQFNVPNHIVEYIKTELVNEALRPVGYCKVLLENQGADLEKYLTYTSLNERLPNKPTVGKKMKI